MASTYSTSLRLELMATGDQSGTWGDTTNTNLGTLLEQAITGVLSVAQGDTTLTLTSTDGASDQARNAVVNLTGAMTSAQNVVVPDANKLYLIKNSTTGGFAVTVKTASGTGVAVLPETSQWVYADGTNVVRGLVGNGVPDANGNIAANNFLSGYATTATAAGTTVLTVASAPLQYFTGTSTQTVTLPVVSTLVLGQSFEIVNLSTGAVTVNSSGGNLVTTVSAGSSARVQTILVTGTTAASWNAVTVGREVLTAARTYYVRTDGSNSNNGLANTSGGAFLTLQYAYDIIASSLDLGGQAVTVQVADGTYTAGLSITQPWTGGGSVTFTGNTSTPANCLISTTSAACLSNTATLPGSLTVQGFKMQTTTGGSGIVNSGVGKIRFGQFDFGAVPAGSYHVFANNKAASIDAIAGYTVSGNASAHLLAIAGVVTTNVLCTLSGTPAFGSAFAIASRQGMILCNGMTFSGSATGPRYLADLGGGIFTNGGGASFLPGDSAGSATSPGWYN
jgi:hypothetical protein